MKNIVKTISKKGEEQYILGTGFYISTEGHILTCAHNIQEDIHIYNENGIKEAKIIHKNDKLDIAILKSEDKLENPYIMNMDYITERCFSYGYKDEDTKLTYQEGVIQCTNCVNENMLDYIITNIEGNKGLSGSPICVRENEAVGIISCKTKEGSIGTVFRIIIPYVRDILRGKYKEPGAIDILTRNIRLEDVIYNGIEKLYKEVKGEIIIESNVKELKKSDIIIEVNNKKIGNSHVSMESIIYNMGKGEKVRIKTLNGEKKIIEVKDIKDCKLVSKNVIKNVFNLLNN
tara:strand:+ start:516 stop:1382 length:867 start_codon:yes stop_codon:yes gene_type:complete